MIFLMGKLTVTVMPARKEGGNSASAPYLFCSFMFFTGAAEGLGEVIDSSYLVSDEEYLMI